MLRTTTPMSEQAKTKNYRAAIGKLLTISIKADDPNFGRVVENIFTKKRDLGIDRLDVVTDGKFEVFRFLWPIDSDVEKINSFLNVLKATFPTITIGWRDNSYTISDGD